MRLVRAARWLRGLAWLGAAACLAVTVIGVCGGHAGLAAGVALHTDGLPWAWAAAMALLLAALTSAALVELARMLGKVRPEALFSVQVTRHFRRFAGMLAAVAVLRLALPALTAIGLAWQAGTPARLELSSDDVLVLLPAGVFFFVARLFDEAARLEDDQRSIV